MEREQYVSIRDMSWDEPKPVVFVHGDVDGMVAACVFVRGRGEGAEIRFTGARRLAGDLQALADRIMGGLGVTEVLIGNVPVRPASIGAARQILGQGVPMVWVDHHTTRQNLVEEVSGLASMNFLYEAELEGPPCALAARALELDDEHVQRLLQVVQGADSEDDWIRDRHVLLSAFIGRGSPDTLRRLAFSEELDDQDREVIDTHLAREAAADEFVLEVEHPIHEISGLKMVVLDARDRDVGYLPRRVEARYGDMDLRVIVPDEKTIVMTSAERGRDLVRLLRTLPWPSGTFVGGRPHQARITPGPLPLQSALDILCDPSSWPSDIEAAATRPPRDKGRSNQRWSPGPRRGGPPANAQDRWQRNFFSRVVEQRVIADLMEEALHLDKRLDVFRGEGGDACAAITLDGGNVVRRVSLYCSRVNADVSHIPVPASLAGRPGACAVWARAEVNPEDGYLDVVFGWFGRDAKQPMPRLDDAGNTGMCLVPQDRFTRVRSAEELIAKLFGWREM